MMTASHLLLVGLGGGLGSILRMLISEWLPAGRLPWGTMAANVMGSLIIGLVLARVGTPTKDSAHWQSFLAVGFCGGFTTFSSFSWQTLEQLRQGQLVSAVLHVLVSVIICLGAAWLGWRLGRV